MGAQDFLGTGQRGGKAEGIGGQTKIVIGLLTESYADDDDPRGALAVNDR